MSTQTDVAQDSSTIRRPCRLCACRSRVQVVYDTSALLLLLPPTPRPAVCRGTCPPPPTSLALLRRTPQLHLLVFKYRYTLVPFPYRLPPPGMADGLVPSWQCDITPSTSSSLHQVSGDEMNEEEEKRHGAAQHKHGPLLLSLSRCIVSVMFLAAMPVCRGV